MSEDLIQQVKILADENATQKSQLKTLQAHITALTQTFNEATQAAVNMRTNLILFQQMVQELNQKIIDKDKVIAEQKAEMNKLLAPAPIPATQPEGEAETAAA